MASTKNPKRERLARIDHPETGAQIKRTLVSDGINTVAHLSLQPGASAKDAHALLKAIAGPKETLSKEIDRRARELEAKASGLAEQSREAVNEATAEARYMVNAMTKGMSTFTPAQVREPLVRAGWLVYQGAAAPLIAKAHKFQPNGRGPGPIRKAIERLLKKQPMKNAEVWQSLKNKPPKGYTVCENHVGRYIEGPTPKDTNAARENMSHARFLNVCAEVRSSLRAS